MINLKYGKGVVLEPFLNRVYGAQAVKQVIWVSPWITHLEFLTGHSKKLLLRLAAAHARLTIITRKPEEPSEHAVFVADAAKYTDTEIIYVPDLHAKYYVCHTASRSFAVIGSPNMYRWTRQSFEIGVAIESIGLEETLFNELDTVTYELKTAQNRCVYKKTGAPPCPRR
jgi:hypothetical protein